MRIRAFNLIPGAAFILLNDPKRRYIAAKVSRDVDIETITLRTSQGTVLAFDFCDEVYLIGLDANLGNDTSVSDIGTEGFDLVPGQPIEV